MHPKLRERRLTTLAMKFWPSGLTAVICTLPFSTNAHYKAENKLKVILQISCETTDLSGLVPM